MPNYTITISELADKAVTWKATKEKKTKAQIFNDYIVDTLIASWIRDMLDDEMNSVTSKWDSLTQTQKDQIRAIIGY